MKFHYPTEIKNIIYYKATTIITDKEYNTIQHSSGQMQ
jgi:hypothetical protein